MPALPPTVSNRRVSSKFCVSVTEGRQRARLFCNADQKQEDLSFSLPLSLSFFLPQIYRALRRHLNQADAQRWSCGEGWGIAELQKTRMNKCLGISRGAWQTRLNHTWCGANTYPGLFREAERQVVVQASCHADRKCCCVHTRAVAELMTEYNRRYRHQKAT